MRTITVDVKVQLTLEVEGDEPANYLFPSLSVVSDDPEIEVVDFSFDDDYQIISEE
jgi:hypothetical protein